MREQSHRAIWIVLYVSLGEIRRDGQLFNVARDGGAARRAVKRRHIADKPFDASGGAEFISRDERDVLDMKHAAVAVNETHA